MKLWEYGTIDLSTDGIQQLVLVAALASTWSWMAGILLWVLTDLVPDEPVECCRGLSCPAC